MRGGAGLNPAIAWLLAACLTPTTTDPVCACGSVQPLTLAQAPDMERDDASPPLRGTLAGACEGAGIVALGDSHVRQISATRVGANGTWALAWPRDRTRRLALLWGCDANGDGAVGSTPGEVVEHVDLGAARAWTEIPIHHAARDIP